MADIELDLIQNSIDSLNEALFKFQQGQDGVTNAYKFCILHLSHFFELILKYYVTMAHPLLIYKYPFQRPLKENKTIGLNDAINFLKNEKHDISPEFEDDLDWLKTLRNDIEHYKFSMDIGEIEETIGRLISAAVDFDESHEKSINLKEHIGADQYEFFYTLAKKYEGQLKKPTR